MLKLSVIQRNKRAPTLACQEAQLKQTGTLVCLLAVVLAIEMLRYTALAYLNSFMQRVKYNNVNEKNKYLKFIAVAKEEKVLDKINFTGQ